MRVMLKSLIVSAIVVMPLQAPAAPPARTKAAARAPAPVRYARLMQCWSANYQYRSAIIMGGGDIPDDNDWMAELEGRFHAAALREGIPAAKVDADEQVGMGDSGTMLSEVEFARCKRELGWHTGHKR